MPTCHPAGRPQSTDGENGVLPRVLAGSREPRVRAAAAAAGVFPYLSPDNQRNGFLMWTRAVLLARGSMTPPRRREKKAQWAVKKRPRHVIESRSGSFASEHSCVPKSKDDQSGQPCLAARPCVPRHQRKDCSNNSVYRQVSGTGGDVPLLANLEEAQLHKPRLQSFKPIA